MGSDSEVTDNNEATVETQVNHTNKMAENGSEESDYDSDDSNLTEEDDREDSDQEMRSCDRSQKGTVTIIGRIF